MVRTSIRNFTTEDLIAWEINLPSAFADLCSKPYGKLFYNLDNPQSHDSNHGVFSSFDLDLEEAVDDLIMFYRLRSLIPRVYTSFCVREKENLMPLLARRGFEFKRVATRAYIRQNSSRIMPRVELLVKRVRAIDPKVSEIIRTDDVGDCNVAVMSKQLHSEDFHLLVGYAGQEPVCTAVLHMRKGVSRLDDVTTHKKYRGRGYGRALIKAVLDYLDQLSPGNHLYLWASNPTAVRIYKEAGFLELGEHLEPWSAWYAPLSNYK